MAVVNFPSPFNLFIAVKTQNIWPVVLLIVFIVIMYRLYVKLLTFDIELGNSFKYLLSEPNILRHNV